MSTLKITLLALIASLTGCGFDCNVAGAQEHFASCDDLQARFDAEQARLDPPPSAAVLDDLDTCGEISGCEIAP